MKNTSGSAHLDLLRTVAAWQVCIHHIKNLFFVDYLQVQPKNLFNQAFYYFSRFGHQSVIIFFVLSGLFIGSSVIKQTNDKDWSWRKYLITRSSRLYIVLLPALLIGGFWDWLGISILGEQNIYNGVSLEQTVISYPVIERLNAINFFANLAFLQDIKFPTFGSNGPLWSLSYEFWYYILFPLIFLTLIDKGINLKRILYFALFIVIANFIGLSVSLSFLIWLLGVAIVYVDRVIKIDKKYKHIATFISFCCLIGAISSTLLFHGFSFVSDMIVGIAASIFIYCLIQYDSITTPHTRYPKIVHSLAGFSYTLYLLHLPFLVFINALIIKGTRWQPDSLHVFIAFVLFAITVLYAFAVSSVTESKTNILRNWLLSRVSAS